MNVKIFFCLLPFIVYGAFKFTCSILHVLIFLVSGVFRVFWNLLLFLFCLFCHPFGGRDSLKKRKIHEDVTWWDVCPQCLIVWVFCVCVCWCWCVCVSLSTQTYPSHTYTNTNTHTPTPTHTHQHQHTHTNTNTHTPTPTHRGLSLYLSLWRCVKGICLCWEVHLLRER